MAAPIYRDEFENRFVELVGFVNTALEAQRIKLTREINNNTDAKFAAVINHYDEQIKVLTKQVETLQEEGARRERKLDAVLKALNVSMEDV